MVFSEPSTHCSTAHGQSLCPSTYGPSTTRKGLSLLTLDAVAGGGSAHLARSSTPIPGLVNCLPVRSAAPGAWSTGLSRQDSSNERPPPQMAAWSHLHSRKRGRRWLLRCIMLRRRCINSWWACWKANRCQKYRRCSGVSSKEDHRERR